MPTKKSPGIWSIHRREIIAAMVVILLFTIFVGQKRTTSVEFNFAETQMTIAGPKGAPDPIIVDYEDIKAISLKSNLELGNRETGLDSTSC